MVLDMSHGTYGITNPPCFLGFVGRLDQVRTLRRVPVVDIAFDLVTKSKQHNAQIDI